MLALVNSAIGMLDILVYPFSSTKKIAPSDITNTDILGD